MVWKKWYKVQFIGCDRIGRKRKRILRQHILRHESINNCYFICERLNIITVNSYYRSYKLQSSKIYVLSKLNDNACLFPINPQLQNEESVSFLSHWKLDLFLTNVKKRRLWVRWIFFSEYHIYYFLQNETFCLNICECYFMQFTLNIKILKCAFSKIEDINFRLTVIH